MDFIQRIASFLDRPLFPWKSIITTFYIGHYLFDTYLTSRQYRVLQRKAPPAVVAKEITPENFEKSSAYGRAKAKFSVVDGALDLVQNLAMIQFDVFPKLWSLTGDLLLKWAPARFTGEISHSIVFLLGILFFQQILNIPSQLYYHFVVEEKFGFNKQTIGLFFTDLVKTNLITVVLLPPITAAFLAIIQWTGNQFFFWLFLFTGFLQIFMLAAYPTFIVPLFNKLTPLPDGELKTGVENLAASIKYPLSDLYIIDGSKRSSHSNAYLAGLPWKKHIALFDTLVDDCTDKEILAVLGHELGHWQLGHTTKTLCVSQAHMLYIFSLFTLFVDNASLFSSFGFHAERPIIIGFLLFNDALAPLDMLVKLGMNWVIRTHEFQADQYACKLGYRDEMARALLKTHIKNLSSCDADPVYATYHYTHPHLTERLRALGWKGTEMVKGGGLDLNEKEKKDEAEVKASGHDEL
ncbi:unnamed protein product [Clonostachys solani]|uniref:CAAX prenyl protease n=1 Tax=Clonostachys solani TaxID=160281 RepID=A0A9N9W226_9HYPO|nr:unnamed protein product [Clonostachys solani]